MTTPKLPPAFPLCWPEDWKRTKPGNRATSAYRATFAQSRDELVREIRLLGARHESLTTDLMLRLDGLPLSKQREPEDPGVAIWWIDRKTEAVRVMACDQWRTIRENMRAVGKAIEALRALERCGASQILERAQQSFTVPALPSPRPWWYARLGLLVWPPRVDDIDQAYRACAKADHPDVGGTHDGFVELGRARDEAIRHATGGAR